MHRMRLRNPSPAMAVAVVALIVALGGTATAAFGPFKGNTLIKVRSLSGNRLKNHAITGTQVNLSQLGTVRNALNADTAGFAANAGTANNSNALGGIAPAGYTHSDCNSQTGQLKGWAHIAATGSFSPTFTNVPGYNCSGEAVQTRRQGVGIYEVKFLGSPVTIAVGQAIFTDGFVSPDIVSVAPKSPGDFYVYIYTVGPSGGAGLVDDEVALMTP